MISAEFEDSDIGGGKKYFEFRYPEDNATQEMKDGWRRLVEWMAHSNPQPKYEKHIAETEDDYKKFSFNQKTQSNIPVYILNDNKTEYVLINDFN